MHHPALDEDFLCGENVVIRDDRAAVAPLRALEAGFVAQGVHQPRLPLGLRPHAFQRLGGELLAGLAGVLADQSLHFRFPEVPQPQRIGADVERAAARDHLSRRTRANAIVPQVAHAAQNDAVREPVWTQVVAGAQLAQYRQQRVTHQGVDLVDQQHQWTRVGPRPARQRFPKRRRWPPACKHFAHYALQRVVSEYARPTHRESPPSLPECPRATLGRPRC